MRKNAENGRLCSQDADNPPLVGWVSNKEGPTEGTTKISDLGPGVLRFLSAIFSLTIGKFLYLQKLSWKVKGKRVKGKSCCGFVGSDLLCPGRKPGSYIPFHPRPVQKIVGIDPFDKKLRVNPEQSRTD